MKWIHGLIYFSHVHNHIYMLLRIKRHNKAVGELRKLIVSSPTFRCTTFMNAGYFNENPPESTVPHWLLPCTCSTQKCQCNSQLCPYIMCVHGAPYLGNPPPCVNPSLTIQFIEFTYTNYRFYEDKVNVKIAKYQPLINDIKTLGWKVAPLIVIIAEVRGTTHIRSITQLHTTYK
jgi:hypothetical protein